MGNQSTLGGLTKPPQSITRDPSIDPISYRLRHDNSDEYQRVGETQHPTDLKESVAVSKNSPLGKDDYRSISAF